MWRCSVMLIAVGTLATNASARDGTAYQPPDYSVGPFDAQAIALDAEARTALADQLAVFVRGTLTFEDHADYATASRLIGLALRLDPLQRTTVITSAMLRRGLPLPRTDEGRAVMQELVGIWSATAQVCYQAGGASNLLIAVELYQGILALQPMNEDALYYLELIHMAGYATQAVAAPSPPSPSQSPVSPEPPTSSVPTASTGVPAAKVNVKSGGKLLPLDLDTPVTADGRPRWGRLPDHLVGAQFIQSGNHYQGRTVFDVVESGRVVLVCSTRWGGGGNSGGGWKAELTTRKQLIEQGWVPLDWPFGPIWEAFERHCEAGESFALRTEKYLPPVIILVDGPTADMSAGPADVRLLNGGTLHPMALNSVIHDNGKAHWRQIPTDLIDAQFCRVPDKHQGITKFEIARAGWVVLACTTRWGGGGNSNGDWKRHVTTPGQLLAGGWLPIDCNLATGRIDQTEELDQWAAYKRFCEVGESFSLRTEKYTTPVVILTRKLPGVRGGSAVQVVQDLVMESEASRPLEPLTISAAPAATQSQQSPADDPIPRSGPVGN